MTFVNIAVAISALAGGGTCGVGGHPTRSGVNMRSLSNVLVHVQFCCLFVRTFSAFCLLLRIGVCCMVFVCCCIFFSFEFGPSLVGICPIGLGKPRPRAHVLF